MPEKQATVVWEGDLRRGHGEASTPDGTLQHVPLTFPQRFESAPGASPEELIAAAHAGCFSMALAGGLAQRGHAPARLTTRAVVTIEPLRGGWTITRSHLSVRAEVLGIEEDAFQEVAREAKDSCPVSRALEGNVEMILTASLARTEG